MKKSFTRIIGIVLVFVMCFSFLPAYAFASPGNEVIGEAEQENETTSENEVTELPSETMRESNDETADDTIIETDEIYDDDDYGFAPFSIMPMSAGFVSHNRGVRVNYGSHRTSYYTADGNTAFCLDPNLRGMNTGVFALSRFIQRGAGYDNLIKAAYYLYGGPGYDSVKHNLFGDPDGLFQSACHRNRGARQRRQ